MFITFINRQATNQCGNYHLSLLSTADIVNVVKVGCGHIQWDPSTVDGCTDNISYRIRIFSGSSETPLSQRVVLSSTTNSLTFSSSQVPSIRPLRAIVSQLITSVSREDPLIILVHFPSFGNRNDSHTNRIQYLK